MADLSSSAKCPVTHGAGASKRTYKPDPHVAEQPLRRFRFPDGHLGWFTTKYTSCRAIMQDPRFTHHPLRPLAGDDGGLQEALAGPEHIGDLLRIDPPEHTKLRRMLAPYFTVARVDE